MVLLEAFPCISGRLLEGKEGLGAELRLVLDQLSPGVAPRGTIDALCSAKEAFPNWAKAVHHLPHMSRLNAARLCHRSLLPPAPHLRGMLGMYLPNVGR